MNNLEKLTPAERAEVIDRFFLVNRSTITVAKMVNGIKHYGFFDALDDFEQLRIEKKFRLVLVGKSILYRDEKNQETKKSYTVIIDCNYLLDLRMIHAFISEEIEFEVPGLKEYLSGKTKMTYKEYLNILHKETAEKMDLYIKAETQLSRENGFIDKALFDTVMEAKKTWQEAHNKYYSMLSFIKNNNINIDSIF